MNPKTAWRRAARIAMKYNVLYKGYIAEDILKRLLDLNARGRITLTKDELVEIKEIAEELNYKIEEVKK